jgi:hypothetical protein
VSAVVRAEVPWREIAGQVVVLVGSQVTRLDPPAALVWSLLDAPVTPETMTAQICELTGAPVERVGPDLAALLGWLRESGLLRSA